VRQELLISVRTIPYDEVVDVEQELISEGLPEVITIWLSLAGIFS
jgi:hypothetical protein